MEFDNSRIGDYEVSCWQEYDGCEFRMNYFNTKQDKQTSSSIILSVMSGTRFRFLLQSNNDAFNETVSLLFSSIAQSKTKSDIVKLVRTSLTETVG